MAEFLQEQADEIEALQAIYPEEFETVDGNVKSYKIHLVPNPGTEDNHVGAALVFALPSDYPSVLPELSIELEKGLSKKHHEELLSIASQAANDNLGMPCIYMVAEAVREWLVDNNVAGQDGSMYSEMMRRMQQKDTQQKKKEQKAAVAAAADAEAIPVKIDPEEAERIRRRQFGTPVTPETFLAWKLAFDLEMQAKAPKDESQNEDKPTGKQLFLTKSAGLEEALIAAAESEEAAQIADAMAAAARGEMSAIEEGVEVAEDLFLDEDLDDDDDEYLDDEDEEEESGDDDDA